MKTEQVTWLNELINEMTTVSVNGIQVHLSAIAACNYIPDLASIVQKNCQNGKSGLFFCYSAHGGPRCMSLPETVCMSWMWVKYWGSLGGGGHFYAASAKVENQTLPQVEKRLIKLIEQQIMHVRVAKKLMSSPAITITAGQSCPGCRRKK